MVFIGVRMGGRDPWEGVAGMQGRGFVVPEWDLVPGD